MRVIYENILKKYKKKEKYSQPNSMNMLTKKLKNIVTYQRNIQIFRQSSTAKFDQPASKRVICACTEATCFNINQFLQKTVAPRLNFIWVLDLPKKKFRWEIMCCVIQELKQVKAVVVERLISFKNDI